MWKEIEHGLFYVLSTCFEAKIAKTFVLYPWVDISKRFHKTVCIIDIISFLLNWPKQPVLAQIYYGDDNLLFNFVWIWRMIG